MGGESKLQTKIINYIEKKGGYAVDIITAGKSGVHDILACYKGHFLSIEVKYGKNYPDALQLEHQTLVRAAGGTSIITYKMEHVVQLLQFLDSKPRNGVNSQVTNH